MQCTRPFHIKNPDRFKYKKPNELVGDEWLDVPCGHCLACRIARTREWTVRLLHESEFWEDTSFVTLTYDDEHLPLNGSLVPRDLTLFFKKLRKDLGDKKIKYYACGEYGDTYGRPHYHAIIFGLSPKDKKLIEDNWQKGFVKIGCVTYDSCRYVAGYVQKKLYGKASKEYEEKGIIAPFSRMSKGLGERYVDKYWNKLYDMNTVTVRGVPMGLPRYYQKKLDYDGFLNYDISKEVDFCNDVLEKNKDFIQELDEKVMKGEISPSVARALVEALFDKAHNESLIVKETNLEAKYSKKKRGSL